MTMFVTMLIAGARLTAARPPHGQHRHGSFEPFGNCLLCAECTR